MTTQATPADVLSSLQAALKLALTTGRAARDDHGSANHDAVIARPPTGIALAELPLPLGLRASPLPDEDGLWWHLVPTGIGLHGQRTAACERLAAELSSAGWTAYVSYVID